MNKVCNKCNINKEIKDYEVRTDTNKCRNSCKLCMAKQRKDRRESNLELYKNRDKEYYIKNKTKINKRSNAYREKNKDKLNTYAVNYRDTHRSSIRKKDREFYNNNKSSICKVKSEYRKRVKHTSGYIITQRIKSAKRRALKLNATPSWSESEKIKVLYEKSVWLESLTGLKYNVDHIIPLQNESVCGLHVWWNLQILESKLNFSKGNKY